MLNNIFNQIPVRLWKRHATNILRYSTKKKITNAAKAYISFLKEDTVISTMPSFLKIELSRHCTVNCIGCVARKEKRFLSFDDFKSFIDKFGEFIFITQLYEIGDPLHHPELIQCIEYAHAKKISTVISTSLSIKKPDDYWGKLMSSGLDRLIVAIDGTTKSVYNHYRVNGNLDLVMSNLKKILSVNRNVFIEWQMIDFEWNKEEQSQAKELACSLGCDRFQIIKDTSFRHIDKASKKYRRKNCIWSYFLFLVNIYGDVLPCFKPGYFPGVIGNIFVEKFEEIWNGEKIRKIRSKVLIKSRSGCCNCIE